METYTTIVKFFQDGGFFMYPIVLVLTIGLAIMLERWFYLSKSGITNQMVWKKLMPMVSAGRLKEARDAAFKSKSAIGSILTYGLDRVGTARRRDDIEAAMEESLLEVMPRLEKRTHYLATLLGLLGTIIGLIKAFTAVAAANPAEKADMLSASISVAMNTTAFGLMVAIPLLLAHTWLSSKTTEVVDSLEMASVKFLNTVAERGAEVA